MLKEPETLRVAIIGSGPAGFFCADYLLRLAKPCSITMFERWPWPFGLVRDAVAPDKPNIRAAANAFTRTALSQGFSFCGNIAIGRDIPLDALQRYYHGIIIASGASAPRPLPIQGASLQGCESAVTFAGWYNGRPDCATLRPNLDCLSAVIIGTGNAAIDVARMLAMPPEALKHTDIPSSALQRLVASKVTDIHIVGRRGPMEVRFAPQELIGEPYRGVRPAPGYPAQPDHSEKSTIFELLDAERLAGVSLTDSYAMTPGSSVSGLYLAHPDSHYFAVGRIQRDQVEDYAGRKGVAIGDVERVLASSLAYRP